ncbi:hypothetical protein BSLG_001125 [Batrachochytrium salamandrivorans]|nr:hypothetical protein BSLG_006608 [Batrachochytrium salamandrivorans]KAJ1344315.1 hypothetical protein BSLG_001125 [Batrachochytrium salamandrivorans]
MKSSHDALAAPLAIPADGLAEKSFPDPRNRSCSTSSSTNSVDATMTSGSVNGDSTPATSPIFVSHTPLSPISNGDTGRRSSSRSTTSTLKSESSASTSNGNRKKSTAGISIMPSSGSRWVLYRDSCFSC